MCFQCFDVAAMSISDEKIVSCNRMSTFCGVFFGRFFLRKMRSVSKSFLCFRLN